MHVDASASVKMAARTMSTIELLASYDSILGFPRTIIGEDFAYEVGSSE